jgi:UDP-N-acetyl-D-glucosamine/UDP-N-acetyl-D-galactosamine dehydrogenase
MYRIAVIGLGYVGLPLAIAFGKKIKTVGFDVNHARIDELKRGLDHTQEVSSEEFNDSKNLSFTSDPQAIFECNVYIISVPTPINTNKNPDLRPLKHSSEIVGRLLNSGDIVIYESTVYPGATEEVCVPILEKNSSLKFNQEFYCGYSPERINPGDKEHRLENIKKVTSGSTPKIAEEIDNLYKLIISEGTHKASSIKVAEAAKVIENTQRDVNIALINELAMIFNRLDIDTEEVLLAAGTKWNFLPFRPGLVGGHCIGIDPYYLTHKSIQVGYHPDIILAGRKINDNMGYYVAEQVKNLMSSNDIAIPGANILILGLSFKENCPDIRNTRIIDLIDELKGFDCNVDVFDPWVDNQDAKKEYGLSPISKPLNAHYHAIVIAVAHSQFKNSGIDEIKKYGKENHIIYDLKYVFQSSEVDGRL